MKIKITSLSDSIITIAVVVAVMAVYGSYHKTMINYKALAPETVVVPISSPVIAYGVQSETTREVTAYNVNDISQCSGDPCIAANGENICSALSHGYKRCAANFVPLGTELQIISLKTGWEYQCLVTDRMNSRFKNRVDIAMSPKEYNRAVTFGIQKLIVRVIVKK